MKCAVYLSVLVLFVACATSPTGRKQLLIIPDGMVDSAGTQAFAQLKSSTPSVRDAALDSYIHCIVDPITQAAEGQTNVKSWEVVVFRDDTVNAFALPGGKIGVHTGILPVANTPGKLAAVLGHEVAHVIAKHGEERMSEQLALHGGLAAIEAFVIGKSNSTQDKIILGALGVGAHVGIALPHSRDQESESDLIGLRLMARAGFEPQEAVALWRSMEAAAGGKSPPEFLSTHPASESRIRNMEENMPEARKLFEEAKAAGRKPNCTPPK